MSSSGGGSSDSKQTKRFAPYVENYHSALLNSVATFNTMLLDDSPYETYSNQDVDTGVIGIGYTLASFPSLYDMFGKYMSGFDVEKVFDTVFEKLFTLPDINAVVNPITDLVDETEDSISTVTYLLSQRELNAISCSTFVIKKAVLESRRLRMIAKISAEVKYKLLSLIATENNSYLNWRKNTIDSYSLLMKQYYIMSADATDANSIFGANNAIWNFTVLDFQRAVLGTMLMNAGYQKSGLVRKRSDISKVLLVTSQVVNGAVIGNMVGGPVGAMMGAAIGFTLGVAQMLLE
ncbi:MAG: glycine zipper family protein [Candidatus Heimdallarchaeaceae archaeon]